MNSTMPLISCICVSRGKPEMLRRIIGCFTGQTYQNKELLIVLEREGGDTLHFQDASIEMSNDIRLIWVDTKPAITLGELRNLGIRKANGKFVCQWDDDDWYHMNRLSDQYAALVTHGYHGCVMTQWLVLDTTSQKAYISNERLWEGSILCRKDILVLNAYENKRIGEDTATVEYLASKGILYPLNKAPVLYMYIYHGNNTWDYSHWNFIFECSTPLSPKDSKCIMDIANGRYSIREGSLLLDKLLERQYSGRGMLKEHLR